MICDSLYLYGAFAVNWDKRYVPFPMWPPKVHFGKIVSGQAVASRYPLSQPQVIRLEKVKNNPFYYNVLYLERLAQIVTVQHPLKTFSVINIHAEAFDAGTRLNQLEYLYDLFKAMNKKQPVILIGDLNSDLVNSEEGIHLFLNDSTLSFAAINRSNPDENPKSYPSVNANERLDYIIVDSTRFDVVDSRVVGEFGDISDHLPVWARLRIK